MRGVWLVELSWGVRAGELWVRSMGRGFYGRLEENENY